MPDKEKKLKLWFLIGETDTVTDVFLASDERAALKVAVEKGDTYTVERVTSKNWKRMAEKFGEVMEGVNSFRDFRKEMGRAFERMGLSPGEVTEAARGRDLDPRATLRSLGLTEADFRDLEDVPVGTTSEKSDDPHELTEAEAEEALKRAMARLGVSDVDLEEHTSLP